MNNEREFAWPGTGLVLAYEDWDGESAEHRIERVEDPKEFILWLIAEDYPLGWVCEVGYGVANERPLGGNDARHICRTQAERIVDACELDRMERIVDGLEVGR